MPQRATLKQEKSHRNQPIAQQNKFCHSVATINCTGFMQVITAILFISSQLAHLHLAHNICIFPRCRHAKQMISSSTQNSPFKNKEEEKEYQGRVIHTLPGKMLTYSPKIHPVALCYQIPKLSPIHKQHILVKRFARSRSRSKKNYTKQKAKQWWGDHSRNF